jgi:hypothetical protein
MVVGADTAKKAFIFKNDGGTWGTTAAFNLDQNTGDTDFGYEVALTDNWMVVGAHSARKAFIFKNDGGTWGTTAAFNLDQNTTKFGVSVALTDNWASVGANDANKAFLFKNTPSTRQLTTITGATAGDFLVVSITSGKELILSTGGNIKMGTKDIILNGDNGDTVSLLYDGTNWLITSMHKNINE